MKTKVAALLPLLALLAPTIRADDVDSIFSDSFDLPSPLYSTVSYPNSPNTGSRPGVDITDFAQVFGHSTNADSLVSFPGRSGSSPVILQFPGSGTVSMQFVVPTQHYQGSVGCSTYDGQTVDIAISTTPWAFPIDPVYASFGVGPGEYGPTWSNYLVNKAYIPPGSIRYYLIRLSTPQVDELRAGFNSTFGP
jgi:hypothetical protein